MASLAPFHGTFWDLLTQPLGRRALGILGLVGVAAMLTFCVSYELIRGFSFDLVPAIFWALAAVIPLVLTYDMLKRVPDNLIFSDLRFFFLFLGASSGAVALSTIFTLLNEFLFFNEAGNPAAIALARVPLMTLLVAASLVSIRAGRTTGRVHRGRPPVEPLAVLSANPSDKCALPVPSRADEPKISLRLQDGHFIPDLSMVTSVTAAANYAEIKVGESVILTRVTMAQLEKRLAAHGFRRIHRSTIVNGALVESVISQGRKLAVKLATGERFLVGPSYREKIIPHQR